MRGDAEKWWPGRGVNVLLGKNSRVWVVKEVVVEGKEGSDVTNVWLEEAAWGSWRLRGQAGGPWVCAPNVNKLGLMDTAHRHQARHQDANARLALRSMILQYTTHGVVPVASSPDIDKALAPRWTGHRMLQHCGGVIR